MTMSRRAFLRSAAVGPAVAIVATSGAVQAAAAISVDSAIAALKPIEFPFRYWVGDGERFGCDFDTLEQAVEYAIGEGSPVVLRARQFEVPWQICDGDVEAMLEHMHEWANEEYGDGDGNGDEVTLDYTSEQRDELVREIAEIFDAWRARHGLRNTAWQFDREGQEEHRVTVPPVRTTAIQGQEAISHE